MYNLLVAGAEEAWRSSDEHTFEMDRFLAYTHPSIRAELEPLSAEAVERLKSYPALFAYEFPRKPSDEDLPASAARVGKIVEITRRQRAVLFRFEIDTAIPPVPVETIREIARELDLDLKANENYRSHWAVKDVDLLGVLASVGIVRETPMAPDLIDELRLVRPDPPRQGVAKPRVFVVHGRDEGIKNEVARWLAKSGLEEVILHEQANLGRTLIAKFREVAQDVAFAVVIMSPDDVGGLKGGELSGRARQNVIFELGYFIGLLGPDRVAALVVDHVERPSDFDGVVYISHDPRGAWKLELAREFKALGIPFDALGGV